MPTYMEISNFFKKLTYKCVTAVHKWDVPQLFFIWTYVYAYGFGFFVKHNFKHTWTCKIRVLLLDTLSGKIRNGCNQEWSIKCTLLTKLFVKDIPAQKEKDPEQSQLQFPTFDETIACGRLVTHTEAAVMAVVQYPKIS